jgi:mRNA-degrading endonuclease RelE of RelBE toxin-antitoxin system
VCHIDNNEQMMTNKPKVLVISAPTFIKAQKRLRKKYRSVDKDVDAVVDQLEAGQTPGDRIQNIAYVVYKVRVANSDIKRGKSAGYRVIYYLQKAEQIFLVYIYIKSDRTDIRPDEIEQMLHHLLNKDGDHDLPYED